MVRICIFAVIAAVVLVCSFGCGQQGAGNTPSGSTEQQATSPGESREPPTTTEETTMPLGLECPDNTTYGAQIDGPPGLKGKKGNPVQIARREFSRKIREGDTVEIAERSTDYAQNATATVHVIREGRVVASIEYSRARAGWLQDSYLACANF